VTQASPSCRSSTGRRRAAREREYGRLRILAMAPGRLVLRGDRAREGDLARAGAPDRRPDLRGGRGRDRARTETS
jgi:hypothetical protein